MKFFCFHHIYWKIFSLYFHIRQSTQVGFVHVNEAYYLIQIKWNGTVLYVSFSKLCRYVLWMVRIQHRSYWPIHKQSVTSVDRNISPEKYSSYWTFSRRTDLVRILISQLLLIVCAHIWYEIFLWFYSVEPVVEILIKRQVFGFHA